MTRARSHPSCAALLSVLLLLSIPACTQPAHDRELRVGLPPGGIKEGREEYILACASCHGDDGRGGGPVVPALRTPPPDLTLLTRQHTGTFPREYVIAVLAGERVVAAHGSREMPVWSQRFRPSATGATAVASIYARRRLELLTSYLESLQHPAAGTR
jgi:mono/diheme cytochrome c family protein